MHSKYGKQGKGGGSQTTAPWIDAAVPHRLVLAPASQNTPETGLPLLAMLHGLRRWWFIALPVGLLLSAAGAAAGWYVIIPKHEAAAYVRISSENERLVFETADGGGSSNFLLFRSTQQQMLLTPFVLNAALRDSQISSLPEVAAEPDPLTWMQRSLQVTFPADGEIMCVSLQTPSATSCIKIVNAVVDAYMNEVVVNDRNERLRRLSNLERVHSEAETKVRNKRAELKTLATALGTGDTGSLTVAQQSALQQFGLMQEKLSTIQFELMQAKGELTIAEESAQRLATEQQLANSEAESPTGVFDVSSLERPLEIIRLEDELLTLRARLKANSSIGASHPFVTRLATEIEIKEQLLAKHTAAFENAARGNYSNFIATSDSAVPSGLTSATYTMTRLDIPSWKTRVQVLEMQEGVLQEKVDLLSAETRQLGRSSIDVELMRSEITGLEEVLRRVGEEIERTAIELKTSSRVRLLSAAENSTPPDPKKRIAAALALGLFGMCLPTIGLVAWDTTRKRVSDVDGVSTSLALNTLGTIPWVSGNPLPRSQPHPSDRKLAREQIALHESVDALAAMILHQAHDAKQKVFMISSAMSGEGKTTLACQLSASLARCGKEVALVDFDLRRPSVHRYLRMDAAPGVSELLLYASTLDEAAKKCEIERLTLIPAGERQCRLQERDSHGALEILFDELRDLYDLVIVDACPVLPVVDARIVGKYTDGVILTLVRDISRIPLAAQAYQLLTSFGIPVLGTVVIGANTTHYGSYPYADQRSADRIAEEKIAKPLLPR